MSSSYVFQNCLGEIDQDVQSTMVLTCRGLTGPRYLTACFMPSPLLSPELCIESVDMLCPPVSSLVLNLTNEKFQKQAEKHHLAPAVTNLISDCLKILRANKMAQLAKVSTTKP